MSEQTIPLDDPTIQRLGGFAAKLAVSSSMSPQQAMRTLMHAIGWKVELDEARAERDRLRAAVDAVLELIDPSTAMALDDGYGHRWFDEADIRRALDPDKEQP